MTVMFCEVGGLYVTVMAILITGGMRLRQSLRMENHKEAELVRGSPALVQGRSCRVRVGRWGVKKRGDRSHIRGSGARAPRRSCASPFDP
jgi:hypothetical protein